MPGRERQLSGRGSEGIAQPYRVYADDAELLNNCLDQSGPTSRTSRFDGRSELHAGLKARMSHVEADLGRISSMRTLARTSSGDATHHRWRCVLVRPARPGYTRSPHTTCVGGRDGSDERATGNRC